MEVLYSHVHMYATYMYLLYHIVCNYDGDQYLYGDRVKIGCNWW